MTELVIAALELCIGDPNGQAVPLVGHPLVDVFPQLLAIAIGTSTQSAHPELFLHSLADTIDRVFQATVTVRVGLDMPCLYHGRSMVDRSGSTRERAAFPTETGNGLGVCVGRLMTSSFDGGRSGGFDRDSKPGKFSERVGDLKCG
jgi:hypothetical protein